jgi:hypothetical protein
MEFQSLSNRLNYFFPSNSWGLLTADTETLNNPSFLQPLKTACIHWNTTLEFPLEMPPQAFDDSSEALNYWQQKLPGIRLLHQRKQIILARHLLQGYAPKQASELFRKKLRLAPENWGYLLFFGGLQRSFCLEFPQKPNPHDLAQAIAQFYTQYGTQIHRAPSSLNTPEGGENTISEPSFSLPDTESLHPFDTELVQRFEREMGISPSVAAILWMAVKNNREGILSQIRGSLNQEPVRIILNPANCSLEFRDMNLQIKLPPLPFALYCLYMEKESGFYNKDRFLYQDRALYWYKRARAFNEAGEAERLLQPCFNPADDKPFRDAIRTIKRRIIESLGDENLAKHYLISGKNGGIKRIPIDRDWMQIL